MQSVCVFCGANPGGRPEFVAAARQFGAQIAEAGLRLIYGGASIGIMGALANGALEAGGKVTGVIPESLVQKEIVHGGLTELEIVADMHTRKARMAELADAFVILPGGLGTLEEMFEVWTWAQLGLHRKPIGLLDLLGFHDKLAEFLEVCVREGFVQDVHRRMLLVEFDGERLLRRLDEYEVPDVEKWLDRRDV